MNRLSLAICMGAALVLSACANDQEGGMMAPKSAAPAQASAAAPAKKKPMRMVTETIYFASGSAKLNDDAKATVGRIIATARQMKAKTLILSGHTDTTGNAAYNAVLSAKRVAAVRAAITRWGVPGEIKVAAHGEERPAVETGDNKGEAKNRRVEVRIVP